MTDDPAAQPPARRPRGRPKKARGESTGRDKGVDKWTLRGVPLNVRAMAVKAAGSRGLTIGDYVAEAIVAYTRSAGGRVSAAQLPAAPMAEMLVDQGPAAFPARPAGIIVFPRAAA